MDDKRRKELSEKIKSWIEENPKLITNTREDGKFYYSYWVWPSKSIQEGKLIPVLIAHLKQLQEGQECILIGWGWVVDIKHRYVSEVMNDPELRRSLVSKLKQIINHKYRINFLPSVENFTEIKVSLLVLAESITKELVIDTILQLWLKYATVMFQFERQSRWPDGSFDPSKHV